MEEYEDIEYLYDEPESSQNFKEVFATTAFSPVRYNTHIINYLFQIFI